MKRIALLTAVGILAGWVLGAVLFLLALEFEFVEDDPWH
jgi:hypothetical protein